MCTFALPHQDTWPVNLDSNWIDDPDLQPVDGKPFGKSKENILAEEVLFVCLEEEFHPLRWSFQGVSSEASYQVTYDPQKHRYACVVTSGEPSRTARTLAANHCCSPPLKAAEPPQQPALVLRIRCADKKSISGATANAGSATSSSSEESGACTSTIPISSFPAAPREASARSPSEAACQSAQAKRWAGCECNSRSSEASSDSCLADDYSHAAPANRRLKGSTKVLKGPTWRVLLRLLLADQDLRMPKASEVAAHSSQSWGEREETLVWLQLLCGGHLTEDVCELLPSKDKACQAMQALLESFSGGRVRLTPQEVCRHFQRCKDSGGRFGGYCRSAALLCLLAPHGPLPHPTGIAQCRARASALVASAKQGPARAAKRGGGDAAVPATPPQRARLATWR